MALDNIGDIPLIGPWVGRVSHVVDIVATPCDVQPMMLVKAFWTSAPLALATLFKPDPVDYLTERGGGPHKRGRRRRFRPQDIIIAEPGTPKGALGWAAFNMTRMIERVGWYILVVDATTQFAVNWTSLAYQWSGCKVPESKYCRMAAIAELSFPFEAGEYIFSEWHVQSQNGFFGDANSIHVPPGHMSNVIVNFIATETPLSPFQAKITGVRITDGPDGPTIFEGPTSPNGAGSTALTTLVKDDIFGESSHAYYVHITKTEGYYRAAGSTFMVYGSNDRGMDPDP